MCWKVVWCDCWLSDFVTMGGLPMPALFERASSGLNRNCSKPFRMRNYNLTDQSHLLITISIHGPSTTRTDGLASDPSTCRPGKPCHHIRNLLDGTQAILHRGLLLLHFDNFLGDVVQHFTLHWAGAHHVHRCPVSTQLGSPAARQALCPRQESLAGTCMLRRRALVLCFFFSPRKEVLICPIQHNKYGVTNHEYPVSQGA